MSNPLFNQMQNMNPMLRQFEQFRRNFTGDPRQQIQQMLNSGKISQAQYNQAVQTAQQFLRSIRVHD